MKFSDIPQYTPFGNYQINAQWGDTLDFMLQRYTERYRLNLNPDYQRPHEWTSLEQQRYVEYRLQGGITGRDIWFNCRGFRGDGDGQMELVDGKQRLNAVLLFMSNQLSIFKGHYFRDFTDHLKGDMDFIIHINELKTRKEVMQWYVDLNSGTPHSQFELNRVKEMILND